VDVIETCDSWASLFVVVSKRTDLASCQAFSNTSEVVMKSGPIVRYLQPLLEFLRLWRVLLVQE